MKFFEKAFDRRRAQSLMDYARQRIIFLFSHAARPARLSAVAAACHANATRPDYRWKVAARWDRLFCSLPGERR